MTAIKWLDDNAEKTVILVCYLVMTGIIFVEVIRRFAFGQQAPGARPSRSISSCG